MECADLTSMTLAAPPCTPSPQPGDKQYLHDEDDQMQMNTICDGMTQINTAAPPPPSGPLKPPPVPPSAALQAIPQYYQYYQYATVPNTNAGSPHYGPALMYMPMTYYPQMRQGTPTYQMDYSPSTMPAHNKPPPMDAPTIVKTPSRQRVVIWNFCQFCQNNKEPEEYYKGHILRDAEGRVVCPILRAYNCPICNNGGGDKAHTKSYCPQLRTRSLPRRPPLF